jgi:uncharacterized protein DUF6624
MKILILLSLLLSSCFIIYGQSAINMKLKNQLDSVMQLDQKYREILSNGISDSTQQDSIAKSLHVAPTSIIKNLWKLQNSIDSANLVFVEDVIMKFGYPGKTLVGEETCDAAWNVIQHSPKIDKYLDIIKKAATEKELPFKLYAMMYDRHLVNHKREQVYGTQVSFLHLKNGESGWFVYPVRNPKKVNKLRRAAGFDQSVEENAKRLDVEYRVIKISEIKM